MDAFRQPPSGRRRGLALFACALVLGASTVRPRRIRTHPQCLVRGQWVCALPRLLSEPSPPAVLLPGSRSAGYGLLDPDRDTPQTDHLWSHHGHRLFDILDSPQSHRVDQSQPVLCIAAAIHGHVRGEERGAETRHTTSPPWAGFSVLPGVFSPDQRRQAFDLGRTHCFPLLLVSPEDICTWLGDVEGFDFSEGTKYQTENGTVGEIRVLRPFHHVRLSWKPKNWAESSTLQIAVASKTEGKTAVRIHHEKLANEKVRNQMRDHWQNVLNKLKENIS